MKTSYPRLLRLAAVALAMACGASPVLRADVGDPQIKTDHPWYPGELACSTFERLFQTEAAQYRHETGISPASDQDKALASWFWRNTHFAHGEEGAEDLWGSGFTKGADLRTREYWTGLFADGFALCGTTHSQWTAEMEYLLGHARGRGVGVEGHNSFEVFLAGGEYGAGRWALLDHDLSTVIFDDAGRRLLAIAEITGAVNKWTDRKFNRAHQQGWLVCGLHPHDGAVYSKFQSAEYLAGYAAAPPMVHLRRGENFRRCLSPGLEDGRTFVFWGRNYKTDGIPGPERSISWVNQPEKMHGSLNGAGYKPGQVRYANAVYTYTPNFANGDYREGIVEESDHDVTFEFYTPYIIGATPPNDKPWGIYDNGCKNGLHITPACPLSISTDGGATWQQPETARDSIDLTDYVKGHRQYLLRLQKPARELVNSGVTIRTVCQANVAVLPRLKDNDCTVKYAAGGLALVSAGPGKTQAAGHIVAGGFDSPSVTLQLASPRKEPVRAIYAAAHVASGNPPSAQIKYQIEFSTDGGSNWEPLVKDWQIHRQGEEPRDFWSQSLCYGATNLVESRTGPILVRFRNDGGKKYLRAEAHLAYETANNDPVQVTFAWNDSRGDHTAIHRFAKGAADWKLETFSQVQTKWVEFAPAP